MPLDPIEPVGPRPVERAMPGEGAGRRVERDPRREQREREQKRREEAARRARKDRPDGGGRLDILA